MVVAGQTAGVGFVAYIFVLLILAKNTAAPNIFVPLTFFYFAALFGICFILLRQGSFASSSVEPPKADDPAEPADPTYLRPVTTAQLQEGFEAPASVTDHTTRTLDEVSIRKS